MKRTSSGGFSGFGISYIVTAKGMTDTATYDITDNPVQGMADITTQCMAETTVQIVFDVTADSALLVSICTQLDCEIRTTN